MGNSFQCPKWILLVCSASISVSCSKADERKDFDLNGNVKSCFERYYEVEENSGKWETGHIKHDGHSRVTFDKKGQYQDIEYYDGNMDLIGKRLPVREKGKVSEEISYDKDEKWQRKTIIKYISENETDFETFDSNGKKTDSGKIIRKNGKMTKQIYTTTLDGEEVTFTSLFEYDKSGNIIQILKKQTISKGEVPYVRFEYLEFDAKNNWTKKLMYVGYHEPEFMITREIEYY